MSQQQTDEVSDNDDDMEMGCMRPGGRLNEDRRSNMPVEEAVTPGGFLEFDCAKEKDVTFEAPSWQKS
jgi:hypothetical protein